MLEPLLLAALPLLVSSVNAAPPGAPTPAPASGALSNAAVADEWMPLAPPILCAATPETILPAPLLSASHLEIPRADGRTGGEPRAGTLAFSTVLQMIDEDARLRQTRLDVQRQGGGALVRGDAAALAGVTALQQSLDRAARALAIDLDVQIAPQSAGATGALSFRRRVRSGDLVFLGTRESRAYVAGFDVEVAADSGSSEPILGRAHSGRGLHLFAARIDGGERVFVWGLLDVSDVLEVNEFDPQTPDLGVLQQPRVASAQVAFSGTIEGDGRLKVDVRGTGLTVPNWTLEIGARTTRDTETDGAAGAGAGFALIDLSLLSFELPRLVPREPGALFVAASGTSSTRVDDAQMAPWPPSAVAALVESARGAAGKSGRASLYWNDRFLFVPRSDAVAVAAARAWVRAAERARLVEGRVDLALGPVSASLPLCSIAPARVVVGSERPLLTEYRLEVAPQIWMPAPTVENAFDGACLDAVLATGGAEIALWSASSGAVSEIARENAQVGKLQLATRNLRTAAARLETGVETKLDLSGAGDAIATLRCTVR